MTACNITVCKSGVTPVVVKFTTATPTPSPTNVPGTPTPVPTAAPVGPPATVHVECTASSTGPGAQIDCFTQFAEDYNSITWEATNATPASSAGGAKSFTTFRDAAGDATVKATVCLNSNCTVSNTAVLVAGPPPAASALGLVDPGEVCTPPGSFQLVAFFDGWDTGDSMPSGVLNFHNPTWAPTDIQMSISPGVFSGKPGAVMTTYYFEAYFQPPMDITVSYAGDGVWPSDSASISIVASACDA
jgi:hypothetical protein